MGRFGGGHSSRSVLAISIAMAMMAGASVNTSAETETATVQPGMYFALFFDLKEGNVLEFEVTSTVAVYVGILDSTNFNSYSSTGDFSSTLFVTSAAETQTEGSVEAPSDGRYYFIVENSVSSSAASVTIDYEVTGDGLALSGLAIAIIVGGVAGAVGGGIAGVIIHRRRKAKTAAPEPGEQAEGDQEAPPVPPSQPPS